MSVGCGGGPLRRIVSARLKSLQCRRRVAEQQVTLAAAVQQECGRLRRQLVVGIGCAQRLDDRERAIVVRQPFLRPLQVVLQVGDRSQHERLGPLQLGVVAVRGGNRFDQAQCTLVEGQRLGGIVDAFAVHVAHASGDDHQIALRIDVLRVLCRQLLVQLARLLHQLHAGLDLAVLSPCAQP